MRTLETQGGRARPGLSDCSRCSETEYVLGHDGAITPPTMVADLLGNALPDPNVSPRFHVRKIAPSGKPLSGYLSDF